MSKRDYYEVLGVDRNADAKEIKKAYRRVAMKHHPDRNEGNAESEEKFKEASEAYEILSSEEKRAAYDRFGHDGVDPNRAGGGGGFSSGGFGDIFGDVFGDIFGGGGGGGARRARRGSDLQYNLELSLEEAVAGVEKKVRLRTLVGCGTCSGSGSKPGSSPSTCGTCNGQGQVRMQQGFFSVQQTCPRCHGQGRTVTDPCGSCSGQGRINETKTLSVKVPQGVDTGDRIRLSGEGEAGPDGAAAGDLFVQIQVKQHAIFERDDADLYCEIPISFFDAGLGGEIEVPTLDGRVKLRIPTETQTGKMFRLKGKGVKPVRGHTQGDLLCRVVVETPVRLNSEQKELMEKLRESLDGDKHSPRRKGWFDGVKKFVDDLTG